MKKDNFFEKVKQAKEAQFLMPAGVSYKKILLRDGGWVYVFQSRELGEIGKLLILVHPDQKQFISEVTGEPSDPITTKRSELLEPITKNIVEKIEKICELELGTLQPHPITEEDSVYSEMMPCVHCGEPTSMLVFVPHANTVRLLEDYAYLVYDEVQDTNVPTWIVGTVEKVTINGESAGEAFVLKIWPRAVTQPMNILSTDLKAMQSLLAQEHCKESAKL